MAASTPLLRHMQFCGAAKSLLRSIFSYEAVKISFIIVSTMTGRWFILSHLLFALKGSSEPISARKKYRGIPFECRWSITFPLPICKEYMQRDPQGPRMRARADPHAGGERRERTRGDTASEKRGSNTISDRSLPQQLATDDPGVLF